MGVRSVFDSPPNETATVTGYVHDDGVTKVLLSPLAGNGHGITLNPHWTPAEARQVAADLAAAADAVERKESVHRPHCGRCDRCGFEMGEGDGNCNVDDCSRRPRPPYRMTCAGCGAPFDDSGTGDPVEDAVEGRAAMERAK